MQEKLHIIEHQYRVDIAARQNKFGHHPACLWFTGLSGSGKSTIANTVEQLLFNVGFATYTLDGDNIRKGLNKDLTFTEKDRIENIRRIGEVAALMCDAGLIVLAAFVSPFHNDRQMVRETIGKNFIEIFVDTPLEVCEQRDVKGLYKKARKGEISNFTGISSPFEAPTHPDLRIETIKHSADEAAQLVVDFIIPKIKL